MRLGKSLFLAVGVFLSYFGISGVASAGIVVDGGQSWTGWDLRGQSNSINVSPGVLGGARGSALNVYKVYSTTFLFDNHAKASGTIGGGTNGGTSGFATSAGSGFTNVFKNGNRILGFGLEYISGATVPGSGVTTIRFDLDGNSEPTNPSSNTYYRAGTSIDGSNTIQGGQGSFSTVSKQKDFTIQLLTGSTDAGLVGTAVSLQANASKTPGSPTGDQTLILNRGSGLTAGEWPFRIFKTTETGKVNNYQVFIDLDALDAQFGINNPNPVGAINYQGNTSASWVGIGSTNVGNDSFSLNGYGDNDVAFGMDLTNIGGGGGGGVVPEPASAAIFALGAVGYGLRALKRSRKN
jgi:hypothetical protein